MGYILFETQIGFRELLCFALCGGVCGCVFRLARGEKSLIISAAIFAAMAAFVVGCMASIDKSHLGYQTFIIPLITFFLIHQALK